MKKELTIKPELNKFEKCELAPTYLKFIKDISFDEWQQIGKTLLLMEGAVQWWIGDWWNFGVRKYGEEKAMATSLDMDYGTFRNYCWVANAIELSCRHDNVSFTHHVEVASLEPEDQEKMLKLAEENHWTKDDLRKAIKREKKSKQKIEIPEGLNIIFKNGDFRTLIKEIPDNSIDLVLTDPPYGKEYLSLWSDLAKESARILKPSGFLISYSGHIYLDKIFEMLGEYLEYYSLMTLYHKGPTARNFYCNFYDRAKPILIFYKPPRVKQEHCIENVIVSEIIPDQDIHKWGQSIEPFVKLIETFTKPGETICDPFVGGGAVLEATIQTKRHFYGYEIEKEYFDLVNLTKEKISINKEKQYKTQLAPVAMVT